MDLDSLNPLTKSPQENSGAPADLKKKSRHKAEANSALSQVITELGIKSHKDMKKAIADVKHEGRRLKNKGWTPGEDRIIRKLSLHWKKMMKSVREDIPPAQQASFLKYSNRVDNILLREKGCRKEAAKLLKEMEAGIEKTQTLADREVREALQEAYGNLAAARRVAYRDLICGGSASDFKRTLKGLNTQAKLLCQEAINAGTRKS